MKSTDRIVKQPIRLSNFLQALKNLKPFTTEEVNILKERIILSKIKENIYHKFKPEMQKGIPSLSECIIWLGDLTDRLPSSNVKKEIKKSLDNITIFYNRLNHGGVEVTEIKRQVWEEVDNIYKIIQ